MKPLWKEVIYLFRNERFYDLREHVGDVAGVTISHARF